MATLLIIAQKLVAMFEDAKSLKELSEREREVCDLLLKGLSAVQVGESLHISPHTARNHMKAIFRKLDVGTQLELINRYA
ncbi:MAG TPA: helix-turn-helix transcriptional regulator [Myxococcota bacterium]|nr:helix-turn-helix transcriptional regulator [Myxococcota bacterium]